MALFTLSAIPLAHPRGTGPSPLRDPRSMRRPAGRGTSPTPAHADRTLTPPVPGAASRSPRHRAARAARAPRGRSSPREPTPSRRRPSCSTCSGTATRPSSSRAPCGTRPFFPPLSPLLSFPFFFSFFFYLFTPPATSCICTRERHGVRSPSARQSSSSPTASCALPGSPPRSLRQRPLPAVLTALVTMVLRDYGELLRHAATVRAVVPVRRRPCAGRLADGLGRCRAVPVVIASHRAGLALARRIPPRLRT